MCVCLNIVNGPSHPCVQALTGKCILRWALRVLALLQTRLANPRGKPLMANVFDTFGCACQLVLAPDAVDLLQFS